MALKAPRFEVEKWGEIQLTMVRNTQLHLEKFKI